MKLKVDADGKAVFENNLPVFTDDGGKDIPFDARATVATIGRLNAEAKTHRERAEKAEKGLEAYQGLDAETALQAADIVANLDDKKLVDAGKVEEVKQQAIMAVRKEFEPVVTERDSLRGQYHAEMVGGRFSRSKFVTDKTVLPPDFMQARFGQSFKVEDGKVVAYFGDGNKVYSRSKPGELAEFEEALELIVEAYPARDSILRSTQRGGSGAPPNSGGQGNAKTQTRTEFEKMSPVDKAAAIKAGTKIVDAVAA